MGGEIASPKSCLSHTAVRDALGGERNKSVQIEAYPVTRTHRRDRHALLQDQRMFDVSIEPKSVRLQVRAIRTCCKQVHGDVMSAVASHRKIKRLCQARYLHERGHPAAAGNVGFVLRPAIPHDSALAFPTRAE